jgi:hypothetical protein
LQDSLHSGAIALQRAGNDTVDAMPLGQNLAYRRRFAARPS